MGLLLIPVVGLLLPLVNYVLRGFIITGILLSGCALEGGIARHPAAGKFPRIAFFCFTAPPLLLFNVLASALEHMD